MSFAINVDRYVYLVAYEFNLNGKKIDFTSDVYSFETTYNQDYIKGREPK